MSAARKRKSILLTLGSAVNTVYVYRNRASSRVCSRLDWWWWGAPYDPVVVDIEDYCLDDVDAIDDDDIDKEECCGGSWAETHTGEILAGAASLLLPATAHLYFFHLVFVSL